MSEIVRDRDYLAILVFALAFVGAVYLNWPALTSATTYRSDTRQGPHWVAYHTDTFRSDDLLIAHAEHNESPLQNTMYYVGTWFWDAVAFGKWMGVISYALTAALFCWLIAHMYTPRAGLLGGLFFAFFPQQFVYYNAFYSKLWAMPGILVCIYLLTTKRYRWVMLLMPFMALAYPVVIVLLGLIILVHIGLLYAAREREESRQLFIYHCVGSGVALTLLLLKYLRPNPQTGTLTPSSKLIEMAEIGPDGLVPMLPIPPILSYIAEHLVTVYGLMSAIVILLVLGRGKVVWERSWSAVLIASLAGYLIAEQLFMHLYLPNRYIRYSLVVLLILWQVVNWDRIVDIITPRWGQAAAVAGFLIVTSWALWPTFEQGQDTMDRSRYANVCAYINTLPKETLVAGHPYYMDDIPIQARRSVLVNWKLAHPWYDPYYTEIEARTMATFEALYATDPAVINKLHTRYGVTHLFVGKFYYRNNKLRGRSRIYRDPYQERIEDIIGDNREFVVFNPPIGARVYEDDGYILLRLPL